MKTNEEKYAKYSDMVAPKKIEQWLSRTGASPKTRDAYFDGMKALFSYVRDRGLKFDKLTEEDIFNFKNHLNGSGYKPTTISIYLAGVRSYYRFAASTSKKTKDIAANVKGMKVERNFKKEALRRNEAKELLGSIERKTLQGKRDYAMINLMIRTGLRDIEVVRALVGDIKYPDDETATLAVHGKGRSGKDDFVVLDEAALSPIREYLIARKALDKDEEPLFASVSKRNYGQPLTVSSLSRIVKDRLRAVGLTGDVFTAHSLRHSAVTYSLLGGATVQEAQAMARHADINTTLLYAHNISRLSGSAEAKASAYLDEE